MKEITAKKSLGQNFLKDEVVLNNIANSINTSSKDLIMEIGPGMGALTKKLLKKDSYLLAFELDERTKPFLLPLESEKCSIIYNDFLKINLDEIIDKNKYENIYVIANIPYYITTPIIEHIINSNLDVSAMTLLVQKEVAERFCATPKNKEYGAITVYLNYYFDVELLCNVKNTSFNPVPKVDSAVVKFIRKEQKYEIDNETLFFEFIKDCFKQKRKTLHNNLKNYDWVKVKEVLNDLNIFDGVRAEELSIDTFVKIYNSINN